MTNIKAETARLLKDEFGIDEKTTGLLFDKGLLFLPACRNVLMRDEYNKQAQPKERQRVKGKIAERYCVSIKLVEKVVLNNS